MTQNESILNLLKKGPVTALDAFRIGVFRLSARIYDLRMDGHKISSKLVKGKKNGTYYSEYTLESRGKK